jgi:hypothetical protein
MVEFVPSPQSQSSTHGNQQHPNEISLPLDNSLYQCHTTDTGILCSILAGWNVSQGGWFHDAAVHVHCEDVTSR